MYRRPAALVTGVHARIGAPAGSPENALMDIEHINAIGSRLADLTRRTQDLRGYL